jgi:diacylglycerol O-acyltransferase
MTSGLVERSREAEPDPEDLPPPEPVPAPWSPVDETLDALRYQATRRIEQGLTAANAVLDGLWGLVRHPRASLAEAAELAASARRLLAPASEPMSRLMTGRSSSLALHALSRPLDALARAGKRVDGTVNDAFVAGVTGGLRRYHRLHGHDPEELRMSMPINLRHGEKGHRAGNQFAPVRFPVPVGIADPLERMAEIRRRVAAERAEPSLPALDVIAGALARLPDAAATQAFGGMLKSVDFVTSNVPGPRFAVYAAGARIEAMIPFGPPAGAATNVCLFSHDGRVHVGANSDLAAIPDPDAWAGCLEQGMDEVLALA